MSTVTFLHNRVSVWHRLGLVVVIGVFIVTGAMRLNDCDLFNPDSPRYLLYSQAIVNLGEYRATDLPGSPLYSWRPPGLSLLLAPILAVRPDDVVAAKCVVLAAAALLLWTLFQLASRHCRGWSALVVTGVIATAPGFLILSTEVLSEVPYTLGTLLVLLLLTSSEPEGEVLSSNTKSGVMRRVLLAAIALTFTPWLRTAGVALVLAVGLWSLTARSRLKWLIPMFGAAGGLTLLAWRNKQAAGENYAGSLLGRLKEQGFPALMASGWETVSYYLSAIPGILLPGLATERSWYAPMTVDPLPTLGLPAFVPGALAAILVICSLKGMWARRRQGGSLVLLYLVIYSGCLVLWPWRHERFLWPLIPLMVAFIPAGISSFASFSKTSERDLTICGTITLVALVGWQSFATEQLVRVNREFVSDRAAFHTNRLPGFYFSNWRQAGTWLAEHTTPSTRVLTWHAAVAGTSHRFQKRVQFETVSPDKLRQLIEGFCARYLVVPSGQFGDGFGWQQLAADSQFVFEVVYQEQDVTILEIIPNRTGAVSKDAYTQWLQQQTSQAEAARRQFPDRTDLAIRFASLLRESGRDEEAIQELRKLMSQGIVTVRVCSELGWLLFDQGQYAEAATILDQARTLPNAESVATVLVTGVTKANERLRESTSEKQQRATERQLHLAKSSLNSLKLAAAEREVDQILIEHPEQPDALFLRGRLDHLLGNLEAAERHYEWALKRGHQDAQSPLLLLKFERAMKSGGNSTISAGDVQETVAAETVASQLRLAELFSEQGWHGLALATLESAKERFPDESSIDRPLAALHLRFAQPELATALYERLLKSNPDDGDLHRQLSIAKAALRQPQMIRSDSRQGLDRRQPHSN